MNAIILSALLGVVMMFSGIMIKNKSAITNIAAVGLFLLLVANLLKKSTSGEEVVSYITGAKQAQEQPLAEVAA